MKRFETRSWRTPYRGLVAVHASKDFPRKYRSLCYEDRHFRQALRLHDYDVISATEIYPELPTGQIIGVASLSRCVPTSDVRDTIGLDESAFGDFGPGRYAWEFEWAERLPHPVPAKGMLGLWSLEQADRENVLGQLSAIWCDADPCLNVGA